MTLTLNRENRAGPFSTGSGDDFSRQPGTHHVKAPVRVPLLLSLGASRSDGEEAVVVTAVSALSRGPAPPPPPPPIEASLASVAVSGDALPAADSVFT